MRGTALLSTILLSTHSSYANNACSANPCGAGAVCSVQGGNNVICSCPDGLQGDPLVSCEAECYRLEDCPFDKQCQGSPGKCIDPCTNNVETGWTDEYVSNYLCSVQGGLHVVLVLIVKQLVIKLSVLVPRHIQVTLLSLAVHLPRLTSAIPTPVAPMPSVSQEWTILQGRTGLCASVRMATEVSITFKFMWGAHIWSLTYLKTEKVFCSSHLLNLIIAFISSYPCNRRNLVILILGRYLWFSIQNGVVVVHIEASWYFLFLTHRMRILIVVEKELLADLIVVKVILLKGLVVIFLT